MIVFDIIPPVKKIRRLPKNYPKLVEYEVGFKIIVDGELFFEEPDFPLLEFLHYINKWKDKECDLFEYISIETEDNPLICFIRKKNMWTIYSPWQLFECKMRFTKEELVTALEVLEKKIYL